LIISESPYPNTTIPEIPLTPFILERTREWEDRLALVDGLSGRSLTFGQFREAVIHLAAGLHELGLRKGDVLAIVSPNIPEYAVVFHAVSLLGGIITTASPMCTSRELTKQLAETRAKYLVTVPDLAGKAAVAAKRSGLEQIYVIGQCDNVASLDALLENTGEVPLVKIESHQDVVVLPYSSGTSGPPKAVMLTHYNLVASLCQVEGLEDISPDDILDGVVPFCHIYGMMTVMNGSLYGGNTVVTLPRFDLQAYLDTLQEFQVSCAVLVPTILRVLAKDPLVQRYDLSKLRLILSGGAPLSRDTALACTDRVGCLIRQGYGLTETASTTHVNMEDPADIQPDAVGYPVPNTRCRIVPATGCEEPGPGQIGEILVQGPQIMKGYLGNPQATEEVLDPEGWLRTGDLGHLDHDGRLYIVDRLKEMIKYKGHQVAPAELEAILLCHPAVVEAAVVSLPDEEAGEIPVAFVVSNATESAASIQHYVNGQVAPHKRIRRIEFVSEIPRSESGKILRRLLRDSIQSKCAPITAEQSLELDQESTGKVRSGSD
jgi:acyl-CoA synthetase (AMP-forming)/AMP-acid ligase II